VVLGYCPPDGCELEVKAMVGGRFPRVWSALAAAGLAVGVTTSGLTASASVRDLHAATQPAGGCALGQNGAVHHVIYIQFDNVHYTRDDPNVPSDLQQMPSLLKFITGQGTLVTHEHTPLIAHTADDIVTSESSLYGSQQGIPIANEYNY
jgi:hypothetical protein